MANKSQRTEQLAQLKVTANSQVLNSRQEPVVQKMQAGASADHAPPEARIASSIADFSRYVHGSASLIRIFDQLMNNGVFRAEVNRYLDLPALPDGLPRRKNLELTFSEGRSQFTERTKSPSDLIQINAAHMGNIETIRHDLAFELHNATASRMRTGMQRTAVQKGGSTDEQTIRKARVKEFTEWLNLIKLGDKSTAGNMGFRAEPHLVTNLKSIWLKFEAYLNQQILSGHTAHYLRETQAAGNAGGASIGFDSNDPEFYRHHFPQLFEQTAEEDEALRRTLEGLSDGSHLGAEIHWAQGQVLEGRTIERLRINGHLRDNDPAKTELAQLPTGTLVEVLDENREGNRFATGLIPLNPRNHFWVQTINDQVGWIRSDAFAR